MKIKVSTLLINIMILSTLFDGVVSELLGMVILIYFFVKERKNILKERRLISLFVLAWFAYAVIQVSVLGDVQNVVRLWGLTKNVCMPYIIFLCFYGRSRNTSIIQSILPIVLVISAIFILNAFFHFSSVIYGGMNYPGAICILLIPYVLHKMPAKRNTIKYIFLLATAIIVIFSGSRSAFITLGIAVIGCYAIEKRKSQKTIYTLLGCVAGVVLLILITSVDFSNVDVNGSRTSIISNITRSLSALTGEGRLDKSRDDLVQRSMDQFLTDTRIHQSLGRGTDVIRRFDSVPHNAFLQVLLCYGVIGAVLFTIHLIHWIVLCIRRSDEFNYIVTIFLIYIVLGYVQPFWLTGTLYQIVIGFVLLDAFVEERTWGKSIRIV